VKSLDILGIAEFFEDGVQFGERVKIHASGIAKEPAFAPVEDVVVVQDLQARGEREFLGDFSEAPAGDASDAGDISGEPAGAGQFPAAEPALSAVEAEAL
jgi:hypothetical protein